jgi:hypothetical protein
MTYCIWDTSPESWHRFNFYPGYLHIVDDYIITNGVKAVISGAISFNSFSEQFDRMFGSAMDAGSVIAFENEDEMLAFKTWFEETPKKTMGESGIGVMIARNTDDQKGTPNPAQVAEVEKLWAEENADQLKKDENESD